MISALVSYIHKRDGSLVWLFTVTVAFIMLCMWQEALVTRSRKCKNLEPWRSNSPANFGFRYCLFLPPFLSFFEEKCHVWSWFFFLNQHPIAQTPQSFNFFVFLHIMHGPFYLFKQMVVSFPQRFMVSLLPHLRRNSAFESDAGSRFRSMHKPQRARPSS